VAIVQLNRKHCTFWESEACADDGAEPKRSLVSSYLSRLNKFRTVFVRDYLLQIVSKAPILLQ